MYYDLCGSDPDPRKPNKLTHKKRIKVKKLPILKCWMPFEVLEASLQLGSPSWRPQDKSFLQFCNF